MMKSTFLLLPLAICLIALCVSADQEHTQSCVREADPQPMAQKCWHFGNCCQRICDAKNQGRRMKCSYNRDQGGFSLKQTECICVGPGAQQGGGGGGGHAHYDHQPAGGPVHGPIEDKPSVAAVGTHFSSLLISICVFVSSYLMFVGRP